MSVYNKYRHLYFFDKEGESLNLIFDVENDRWRGKLYFPKVSVKLFESINMFITEEFSNTDGRHGFPKIGIPNADSKNWNFEWEDSNTETISLYGFEFDEKENANLIIYEDLSLTLDNHPTSNPVFSDDYHKITSDIDRRCMQINFAFRSFDEDIYERKLFIKEEETNDIIAEIDFYAESEAEDDRLNVLLDNLGHDVKESEFKALREADINEDFIDYELLNQKRKEMLLEGHNIYPYVGSYKALVNVIKFFGYDNIKVREYWRLIGNPNIEFKENSATDDWATKYKSFDVNAILEDGADFSKPNINLPSKTYRKSNRLSLVFQINKPTGKYDKFDIMMTEELLEYPIEEVLLKLFALKEILRDKYLPLNARIWEIIGEADYFNKVEFNAFTNQQRIDEVSTGIKATMKVTQAGRFIKDLRGLGSEFMYAFTEKEDFEEINDTTMSMSTDDIADFYVDPGYYYAGYTED